MSEKKAEEHAEWFAVLARTIYRTAFIHGYKHGKEDATDG